jgi:hypothetical protein
MSAETDLPLSGDPSPFAPLHRQLGITPYIHRQAVLHDPGPGMIVGRYRGNFSWDARNRVWASDHLYRASVTLAGW